MLSVISKGTAEDRRDAKRLKTGKCSDCQKGNRVRTCQFPDRECNFTLRQGSQADCQADYKGQREAPTIGSDVCLEPAWENQEQVSTDSLRS